MLQAEYHSSRQQQQHQQQHFQHPLSRGNPSRTSQRRSSRGISPPPSPPLSPEPFSSSSSSHGQPSPDSPPTHYSRHVQPRHVSSQNQHQQSHTFYVDGVRTREALRASGTSPGLIPPIATHSPLMDYGPDEGMDGAPVTKTSSRRSSRLSRSESVSSARNGYGGGGSMNRKSGSDLAFLQQPPPNRKDALPTPPDERRPSLMPRSAVANYFSVDFSFLDDEPPEEPRVIARPESSAKLRRPLSTRSDKSVASSKLRASISRPFAGSTDSLDLELPAESIRSRGSIVPGSPNGSSARLPFPSRPGSTSRHSNRSPPSEGSIGLSRSKSLQSPSSRLSYPRMPDHGKDYHKRFSRDSDISPSTRASFSTTASSSATPVPAAPAYNRHEISYQLSLKRRESEDDEKRKRLVLFLDETAAAMEGGKSLTMVLPDEEEGADSREHLSLSDLAESSSPRTVPYRNSIPRFNANPFSAPSASFALRLDDPLASPRSSGVENGRHSPYDSAALPGAGKGQATSLVQRRRDMLDVPSSQDRPDSVYFTPTVPTAGLGSSENGHDDDHSGPLTSLRTDLGLGLGVSTAPPSSFPTQQHSQQRFRDAPASERSPATVRAESPRSAISSASQWQPQEKVLDAAEVEVLRQKAKMAEKRRRTIEELIETESSYATDMAVVRDIYLARARGADMAAIADHVMSTGLGLTSGSESLLTPPPSATSLSFPGLNPPGKNELRRPTLVRRVSSQPTLEPGEPLMSAKDIRTIFANLEEIAGLAQDFAQVMDAAWNGGADDMGDRVGMIFVEMMPRIQVEYGSYCARHHRAITRLQELAPSLTSYVAECSRLSKGRTGAWDLASLLIKPVQRCLKYPLLITSIISVTPDDHPDKVNLERAYAEVMTFAEHLNHVNEVEDVPEFKKPRADSIVPRSSAKKESYQRRESTASALTRKFLRPSSSSKPKPPLPGSEVENHDMFDALSALVDSNRSLILRFESEMRDWSRTTLTALETHHTLVQGWIDMYGPIMNGGPMPGQGHERMCLFMDTVLHPIIAGPLREAEQTVRHQLLVKTEHLLSMFESPRSHIIKRNNKMLEHSRYQDKHQLADRAGSQEFAQLTATLLQELPPFLTQIDRYFKIIINGFAEAQALYTQSVQELWTIYARECADRFDENQPTNNMMATLAAGLQVVPAPLVQASLGRERPTSGHSAPSHSSHAHNKRHSRHRTPPTSAGSGLGSTDSGRGPYSTNRSSLNSDSSTAPSFSVVSTNGSSVGMPSTPPPPMYASRRPKSIDGTGSPHIVTPSYRNMAPQRHHPLPPVPAVDSAPESENELEAEYDGAEEEADRFDQEPRPRAVPGREHRPASRMMSTASGLSAYSVYVAAEEGYDEDVPSEVLYRAAAMATVRATAYRGGYPLLSHEIGDIIEVHLEEADQASGGSGWLLGRKADGTLGWGRTENFHLAPDA